MFFPNSFLKLKACCINLVKSFEYSKTTWIFGIVRTFGEIFVISALLGKSSMYFSNIYSKTY